MQLSGASSFTCRISSSSGNASQSFRRLAAAAGAVQPEASLAYGKNHRSWYKLMQWRNEGYTMQDACNDIAGTSWTHHLHLQVSALVGLSCMRLKPKSLCSSWICWTSPLSALAIDELTTTFKNSTMTSLTCLICIDLCNTTTLLTSLKVPWNILKLRSANLGSCGAVMNASSNPCHKDGQRVARTRTTQDLHLESSGIRRKQRVADTKSCESCGTRKQLAGKRTAAVKGQGSSPNASG